MEKTINIKFDEEQLEELVKKVTENIIKEMKDNFHELSDTGREEPKKWSVMYLEVNEFGLCSETIKLYFGCFYNTLLKENASDFDFSESSRKEVNKLKSQGWKEEVVYK